MKIQLIEGWKLLWKAWSVRFAALGIAAPEIFQLIADNTDTLAWMDEGWKSIMRLVCLVLVVLSRPVKQVTLEPKEKP